MKIKSIDAKLWRCPECKKNHFRDSVATTTLLFYQKIFKDGVNINPDKNAISFVRDCLECGTSFAISGNEDGGWTVGVIKKPPNPKFITKYKERIGIMKKQGRKKC